jgi:outer membrane cobalamin receptor
MGWGTYSNSPTVYFRLPPQGNNNSGIIGIVQRNFRGERSGLDDPYYRTAYIQNDYKPNDKFSLHSNLRFRETGHGTDGYVYITVDGRKMIRVPIASYSNRFSGEVSAHYSISEKHRFAFGFQFNRDNVERGSRGITFDLNTIYLVDGRDTVVNLNSTFLQRKYDIRSNVGGYGQYVLATDLLKKTTFTLGLRFDHNSYFGNAFSPRVVVVNQPNDKLTFKFQYGNAFRSPTNLEIYQLPANSGFKLKKENLKTYEFNVLYNPSKNANLQLNLYRNNLSDVIVLANLNNLTPDKNPAVFKITGAELISEMVFTRSMSAFFNITYTDTWGKNLVTGTSGKLPAIAKFKGNMGLTIHANDIFTVSLSGNWVGERPVQRTNPHGPVDGYFLTNCTISSNKIFKDRVTASLNVRNIFNVKWLDPGFRTADGLLYSTVLEQPGINGLFKIGIDF